MSPKTCPSCREQSRDGHLCHKCTRSARSTLAQISDLWPALQETVTRQDHFGAPSEIHADAIFGPLPYREPAARVASEVRTELVGWVRICWEGCGCGLPRDTVPAMVHYLRGHAKDLRKHEAAAEWVADITSARNSIVRAVDLTDRRAPAGPCPEHTADGEPCPGLIVAVYPVDESQRPRMDCTKPNPDAKVCARSWPPEDWRHLGARIHQRQEQLDMQMSRGQTTAFTQEYSPAPTWLGAKQILSIADAAVIYNVPESALRRWVRTGDLVRHQMFSWPRRVGKPTTVGLDPAKVEPLATQYHIDRRKEG